MTILSFSPGKYLGIFPRNGAVVLLLPPSGIVTRTGA